MSNPPEATPGGGGSIAGAFTKREAAELELGRAYPVALRSYLSGAGESALEQAYGLGRNALAAGVSHMTFASCHHEALATILEEVVAPAERADVTRRAANFFEEGLAPYEMALRGFSEAVTSLRRLNTTLEDRVKVRTAELTEAIRVRDEFLSIASHELKTPLTALSLQMDGLVHRAERAGGGTELPEWLIDKIRTMRRHVGRLGNLLDNLLDVSAITAGHLAFEPSCVDLRAVVEEVAARYEDALEQAGCTLTLRTGSPIPGHWDPGRLAQVLTNLLSNAMKFGAGKPIEITVEGEREAARLSVRDHGIGIATSDQERLFQRFERFVSARHYGGFGLGLWITRQIVEAMGGQIAVTSALGGGATFTVTLPRTRAGCAIGP